MKRPGLTSLLVSATLFLAAGFTAALSAQEKVSSPPPKSPVPAMGAPKRLTREEVLKRFDRNGDGRIDEDERADARESMLKEQLDRRMSRATALPGGPEAFRALALELFDQNRDGQLDEEERLAARSYAEQNGFGFAGELREELVKRFDRNANGRIDDEERPALFAYLRERRATTTSPSMGESELQSREAERKRLEAAAAEVAKRRQAREKMAEEKRAAK